MNTFYRFLYILNFVIKPAYWVKHVPLRTPPSDTVVRHLWQLQIMFIICVNLV